MTFNASEYQRICSGLAPSGHSDTRTMPHPTYTRRQRLGLDSGGPKTQHGTAHHNVYPTEPMHGDWDHGITYRAIATAAEDYRGDVPANVFPGSDFIVRRSDTDVPIGYLLCMEDGPQTSWEAYCVHGGLFIGEASTANAAHDLVDVDYRHRTLGVR
jgi:hypothetical protein